MVAEKTKRIEWIDLAKGFCIVLVVLSHTSSTTEVKYPFSLQAMAFRMPLYFILSGLFFKQYEGFIGFIKRKTNKLLIPFLFFFVFTGVLPILYYHGTISEALSTHPITFNASIWFLLCLFFVNILFYCIQYIAFTQKSRIVRISFVLIVSLLCGFIGLILASNQIRLPLYLDSALGAMPFFAFGWFLFRQTDFLRSPFQAKDFLIAIAFLVVLWISAAPVEWYLNNILTSKPFILVYLSGICGTMFVLYSFIFQRPSNDYRLFHIGADIQLSSCAFKGRL